MDLDKSITVIETVPANTTNHVVEFSNVIPSGESWVITYFKCAVETLNDNYSGNIVLRHGSDIIEAMILKGNTIIDEERHEIVGDGLNKLNVLMQNPSSVQKKFYCRVKGYKQG